CSTTAPSCCSIRPNSNISAAPTPRRGCASPTKGRGSRPSRTRKGTRPSWARARSAARPATTPTCTARPAARCSSWSRATRAPPGVPAEQIKALRAGFAAAMRDKDFLADAEKTRVDVVPTEGEKVQQLIERLYATPKHVAERAKELVRP